MNKDDLNLIENKLNIKLPTTYCHFMLNFPIPACVGNDDTELWDNVERLISENKKLREGMSGGVRPWPNHFFCLGDAGSGCVYALDLREPDVPVWWVDHCHLDLESSGEVAPKFLDWANDYIKDLLNDLEGEGIDPNTTPEERDRLEEENAKGGCLASLLLLILITTIFLAVVAIIKWVT